ncbi:MAG TPA: tetratricopeptide repeat protein [Vicinamibacterales bacterium]|nr:tetratricopeptide repeat protein [Vicinamibacterales bacterium]
MSRLFATLLILVAGSVASGCALRSQASGAGAVASGPVAPVVESLDAHIARIRHLSARPAKASVPASIEQQDPQLAAALLRLSLSPTGESHRAAGERYRALGIADAAYRHFSRAVAIDGRDAAAHDGLARVWRDWGFPELALGDAHRAVFYAPASAAAQNTMGTVFQALGQHDQARKAYERASRLEPGAVYALSNLCYLAFLHGDFDRAVSTCRSALAVDPAFMAARNNLALAHAAAGRLDLARTEFMDAGDEAVGLFNIGIVHMAARDYVRAAKAFDAASRANPSMGIARERATQARQLGRAATRETSGDPK